MSESTRNSLGTAGAVLAATPRAGRLPISLCLLAVMGLELAARLSGSPAVQVGANVAMFLTVLAAVRDLGFREIYLLTLCGGLTLLTVWLHPDPGVVLSAGLDQASFLMAFLLLLNLLHEAAST